MPRPINDSIMGKGIHYGFNNLCIGINYVRKTPTKHYTCTNIRYLKMNDMIFFPFFNILQGKLYININLILCINFSSIEMKMNEI